MARKRTKQEALDRLDEMQDRIGDVGEGKASLLAAAGFAGARGLVYLDPFNRLADERIVLPLDMVCIPAYQAYMINGAPSMQIYVRAGETIVPTGGNVKDVEEAMVDAAIDEEQFKGSSSFTRKRKPTAYQKKYKAAFKSLAPKYKLRGGKWKKGGFRACVKAAHKKAGGKK